MITNGIEQLDEDRRIIMVGCSGTRELITDLLKSKETQRMNNAVILGENNCGYTDLIEDINKLLLEPVTDFTGAILESPSIETVSYSYNKPEPSYQPWKDYKNKRNKFPHSNKNSK